MFDFFKAKYRVKMVHRKHSHTVYLAQRQVFFFWFNLSVPRLTMNMAVCDVNSHKIKQENKKKKIEYITLDNYSD
jgi:hypothetical protein